MDGMSVQLNNPAALTANTESRNPLNSKGARTDPSCFEKEMNFYPMQTIIPEPVLPVASHYTDQRWAGSRVKKVGREFT